MLTAARSRSAAKARRRAAVDLARLDAEDGDVHSALLGDGGDPRRRARPRLLLHIDEAQRTAVSDDVAEGLRGRLVGAGAARALVAARDQSEERPGARV